MKVDINDINPSLILLSFRNITKGKTKIGDEQNWKGKKYQLYFVSVAPLTPFHEVANVNCLYPSRIKNIIKHIKSICLNFLSLEFLQKIDKKIEITSLNFLCFKIFVYTIHN